MESIEFLAYINNPVAVDANSLKQFEDVHKEYPFCQTAQLLFALNLYAEEHPQYAVQLKRASAYAADRRQLKRLIDRYRITHPKQATPKIAVPVKPIAPAKFLEPSKPSPPPSPRHYVTTAPLHPLPTSLPSISQQPRVAFKPVVPGSEEPRGGDLLREKLLEIVHRRLNEIAEEHGESLDTYQPPTAEFPSLEIPGKQRVTFSVESPGPLSKKELIEKFIREEPRISSPRKVFLKPTHLTSRDLQEEDEIVSETLAILYYKQGNTGKSIRVYEKLCLLFPKKSSYFAARIEALKTQEHPDNEGYES
ncbi:MAG: hypothetical protein V2B15_09540 [Bacteroidota bacterium]